MNMTCAAIKTYAFRVADDGSLLDEFANDEQEAGERLATLAHEYAADHDLDFLTALHRIKDDPRHASLVKTYGAGAVAASARRYAQQPDDPMAEIDDLAQQVCSYENCSYAQAVAFVLRENPDLAQAYSQS